MAGFVESFDSYFDAKDTTKGARCRWAVGGISSGDNDSTMIAGRFGGQALRLAGSPTPASTMTYTVQLDQIAASGIRFNLGFRFQNDNTGAAVDHIQFGYNGTEQVGFRFSSNGSMTVRSGGVVLYTYPIGTFMPNVWHTLGGIIKVDNSVGEVHLRVDGDTDSQVDITGVDTLQAAVAQINTMSCAISIAGSSNVTGFDIDDIVVEDVITDFLPELRSQQIVVNADGSHLDFTPSTGVNHYAVVDESVVDTTDYLTGSTVGQYDLLGVSDLAVVPASIWGIQMVAFMDKTDANTRAVKLGIDSGGTLGGSIDQYLTNSINQYREIMQTDPNTSAAWDQTGINGIQARPEITV